MQLDIFVWPGVVLAMFIIFIIAFYKPIRSKIDRTIEFTIKGVKISAQPTPEEQKSGFEDLLNITNNNLVLEQEKVVTDELNAKNIYDPHEREKVLLRHYATVVIIAQFEKTYYTIWGSQLALLQTLNQNQKGLSTEYAKNVYEQAAVAFPLHYANYGYENWLGFLDSFLLIVQKSNNIFITARGREFLAFLTHQGYPLTRDG